MMSAEAAEASEALPAAAAAAAAAAASASSGSREEDEIWDLVSCHKYVSVDWGETALSILGTLTWLTASVLTVLPLLALFFSVVASIVALPCLLCKARKAKGSSDDDERRSIALVVPPAARDSAAARRDAEARDARAHEKAWLQPFSDARFAVLHVLKVIMFLMALAPATRWVVSQIAPRLGAGAFVQTHVPETLILTPLVALGMFVVHNAAWTQTIKQKAAAVTAQGKLRKLAMDTRELSGERIVVAALHVQELMRDALVHFGDKDHAGMAVGAAKDVFAAVKDGIELDISRQYYVPWCFDRSPLVVSKLAAFIVVAIQSGVTWLLFRNVGEGSASVCMDHEQCVFCVAAVLASAWYFFAFYSALLFGVLEYGEACEHWGRVCELVKPFSPDSHKEMTVVRRGYFRKDVWRCPRRCSVAYTFNKLFSGSLEVRVAAADASVPRAAVAHNPRAWRHRRW